MSIGPKTTLNISNFLSRVRESGFSRLNRIAIVIKPPAELIDILNYKQKDDYLTYFAESVTIPGFEMLTTDLFLGGPPMSIPIRGNYREVNTTFLVDDDMRQKMFFDAWTNFVNPKENKFDFRYRDDYIGEIDILQITEDGRSVSYGVRLYEVFPIGMGDVKGSWAEQEPVRLDVTFSYRYWRSLNADAYERSDSDAPDILESIDVVGRRRENEILDSIDVVGRRNPDRETEILESINVTGQRRPSTVPQLRRSALDPKRPARPTRG